MDYLDILPSGYSILAWLFVGFAAICFGITAAKLHFPSARDQVRRGDCPECRSRKSLRVTPYSRSSAILTCGNCVSQWLVENTDGEQIIHGPGAEPVMPSLRMTHHPLRGDVVFETNVGIAVFDLHKLDTSARWGLQSCETPRHKLSFLFRTGVAPVRVDLTPVQAKMAKQNETTPYNWFAASAGLDIYWIMPGWTKDLHGTTERRDD